MTLFFILAAVLVLLSLGWVLYGLFRPRLQDTDQEAVNITLARERRDMLDTALADGAIDQATHEYERKQLEYDLATDLQSQTITRNASGRIPVAILVSIFIPVAAGALYLQIGDPAAITRERSPAPTENPGSVQSVADLLPQLEQRLNETPDDVQGWRLLGRSYLSIGEFTKSRTALEKAVELDGNDVATLATLAEAVAMTQDGSLEGEPLEYLRRAQALDPENEHAMWLRSIAYQQAGDHQLALNGFNELALLAQDNPQALASIEQMRRTSIEALSLPSANNPGNADIQVSPTDEPAPDTQSEAESQSEPRNEQAEAAQNSVIEGITVSVDVSMSESARAQSSAEQTVFVYARASNGPPMPLAVRRLQVADLPTTIELTDAMAMIPTMKLSAFESVTVGARISRSGNAIAESGDWFNEVENISTAQKPSVSVLIDRQTP